MNQQEADQSNGNKTILLICIHGLWLMDQRLVDELSVQVNGKELGEYIHFPSLICWAIISREKEGSREVPEPLFAT